MFRSRSLDKIIFLFSLGCVLAHSFTVHSITGQWNSGSDTVFFSEILFFNKDVFDLRYIGVKFFHFLFNPLTFDNSDLLIKSLSFKFSLLSISFLSILECSKVFQVNKNVTILSYLMATFLSLYLLRDSIILSILLIILTSLKLNNIKLLILALFLMIFFRPIFFVISLMSIFIFYSLSLKSNLLKRISVILIFVLIIYFGVQVISKVTTYAQTYIELLMLQTEINWLGVIKAIFSASFFSLISSYSDIVVNQIRALYTTNIAFLFTLLIYFLNYYVLISLVRYSIKSRFKFNPIETYAIVSALFIIFIYGIYMDGIQERIRITLLIPLILVFGNKIFNGNKNTIYSIMISLTYAIFSWIIF